MPAAEGRRSWLRGAVVAAAVAGMCGSPLAGAAEPPAASAEAAANAGLELGLEDLLRQGLKAVPQAVQVSTASRFAQSAEQAPAVTYVLTDTDIRAQGLRSLADILNSLPGLYITSNGNFVYVGARGLGRPGDYNSRLLLLVDGVRINENLFDAALIGPEFFLDIDLIERVEFAPGPGSALYGNNAFFGVINVQTKRADKLAGVRTRLAYDSLRGASWQASAGRRFDSGAEAWLSLSGFQQDQIALSFPAPEPMATALRDRNWDRGTRLVARASMAGWTLRLGHSERVRGFPSMEPTEQGEPWIVQGRSEYRNGFAALGYETALGPDLDLAVEASSKHSLSRRRVPVLTAHEQLQELDNLTEGRWDELSLRLASSAWHGHYLLAGLEWQRDREQNLKIGLVGQLADLDVSDSSERLGLFVQDEWQMQPQHRLVLGLRWDRDRRVPQARLNPRLAWVWQIHADANLKFLYGSAFRAANFYEFRANDVQGLPAVDAERIRNMELAIEHRLTPQLQYRASLYRARISGLISPQTLPDYFQSFYNSQGLRSTGLELGLERRWSGGARLQVSVSLQRSRELAGEGELDNSPQRLLKLQYSQPLWRDDLQLGWQLQAMSRRKVPAGTLRSQALHHVNLLWRQDADSEWSLGVRNLSQVRRFDQPDLGAPPLLQEGRVLRLQYSRRMGS